MTGVQTCALPIFFVSLGVRSLKVTGGEPTVRADLPVLVRMFREVGPDLDISMTTNGVLLDRLAAPLAEAGLDRVTVSCDSLLRHRFEEMTRRDALAKVFAGLKAAEDAGLTPIKINCVVIGGKNEDEVVDFARWSRETGYAVRFIEYMPLDAQHAWEREKVFPSARILAAIDAAFPLKAVGPDNEPATSYTFADGAPVPLAKQIGFSRFHSIGRFDHRPGQAFRDSPPSLLTGTTSHHGRSCCDSIALPADCLFGFFQLRPIPSIRSLPKIRFSYAATFAPDAFA